MSRASTVLLCQSDIRTRLGSPWLRLPYYRCRLDSLLSVQVFSRWKDALLVVSKALSAHSMGNVSLTGGRQGKVLHLVYSYRTLHMKKAVLPLVGNLY